MKKLISISLAFAIALTTFAQCDPATIKDIPSVYSKGYEASYKPTPEQEKYITTIFKSVVEPALKSTNGLKGSWKPMGRFMATPEGFTKSLLESFMFTLGCKDNRLYKKDEQGLVLSFTLNALKSILKSQIAEECSHEESKWVKADYNSTIYVQDVLDGRQIYYLKAPTATTEYPNIAFYRKTGDGEYFVICKPGIPLFTTLTVRQALEINKKKCTNILGANKQNQFLADVNSKQIKIIDAYLKNTSTNELDKPCRTNNTAFLSGGFGDNADDISNIKSSITNSNSVEYGTFVILNPAYFNTTVSKTAPQFISIELETQGNSAVTLKAYNNFKANLDLNKLISLLVK